MRTVVGGCTVSDALVVLLRPCPSATVMGSDFAPTLVAKATVAVKENGPLPVPVKGCAADPPMEERSPVTVIPVLGGALPGVTVTVMTVEAPGSRLAGLADATPVGGVELAVTVSAIEVVPVRPCP